ncbi:hypothetical protein MKY42_31110 [Paenibacillus sp. FSL W7-1088]
MKLADAGSSDVGFYWSNNSNEATGPEGQVQDEQPVVNRKRRQKDI